MMSGAEIKKIVTESRPAEWRTLVESSYNCIVVLRIIDPDGDFAGSLEIWRNLEPEDNAVVTTGAASGAKGSIADCVRAICEELRPGEEF